MKEKGISANYYFNFYFGCFLVGVVFFTMVVSSCLFMIKIPITQIHLFAAITLDAVNLVYIAKNDITVKQRAIIIVSGILILCLIIAIMSYTYDYSYDGNTYHKTGIAWLEQGYNPLFDTFQSTGGWSPFSVWVEHYPQGSYTVAASVYILTHNIESGKIITSLLALAVFFIAESYLSIFNMRPIPRAFVALILAFNPITMSQMLNYYVDGMLSDSLFLLILSLLIISNEKYRIGSQAKWGLLAAAFVICANLKFTGLVYALIFSFAFFVFWIYAFWKQRNRKGIRKLTTKAFFIIFFSVCIIGAGSYVKNFAQHGSPFYPIYNNDTGYAIDEIPKELMGKNPFYIFFVGYWSSSKVLLIALLVSVVVMLIGLFILYKTDKKLCLQLSVILFICIFLNYFISASFMPRISVYLMILPPTACSLILPSLDKFRKEHVFSYSVLFLLIVGVAAYPNFAAIPVKEYEQIPVTAETVRTLEKTGKPIKVHIGQNWFWGALTLLDDHYIRYEVVSDHLDGMKPLYGVGDLLFLEYML